MQHTDTQVGQKVSPQVEYPEYKLNINEKKHTCKSSNEVGWVANKAPSSKGGEGSPSSSSTTKGFTESGVPSLPKKSKHEIRCQREFSNRVGKNAKKIYR